MLKAKKLSDFKLYVQLKLFLDVKFNGIVIVSELTFLFVKRELLAMGFLAVL